MKTIRENEKNIQGDGAFENTNTAGDLSEVLYAVIRHLNYLYDTTTDELRKEEILDKKARLMLQLLLMEENHDLQSKGKNSRKSRGGSIQKDSLKEETPNEVESELGYR